MISSESSGKTRLKTRSTLSQTALLLAAIAIAGTMTCVLQVAAQTDEGAKRTHLLPHLADGDGWQSILLVTNAAETASLCTLDLFGLSVERFQGAGGVSATGRRATFELAGPAGHLVWRTRNEAALGSGYAKLDCSAPVVAQVVFASIGDGDRPTGMATVFSSQTARAFQFPVLTPAGTVGYAVANDTNLEANCDIRLEDPQRMELGKTPLTVPAKSNRSQLLHQAIAIPETFPGGSAMVTCDQPVAMIGLHYELEPDGAIITFNTLPPAVVDPARPSSDEAAKTSHLLPHIADGGGWQSILLVTNVTEAPGRCTLDLYGLTVNRFQAGIGETAGTTAMFDVPERGGYLVWRTRNEGALASGYAKLDCTAAVVSQVVFAWIGDGVRPTGMATVFSSQTGAEFQFPVLSAAGTVGFAVANDTPDDAACRIILDDQQEMPLGEASLPVPAKTTAARLLNDVIPIPASFHEGLSTVTCDKPVAMIGLHYELESDGAIITFNTLRPAVLDTTPPHVSVPQDDPFAHWNDLEPEPWWRESEPYSCLQEEKQTSPWLRAGLIDLGGSDPLSLIRYFGNGSYLRYGHMGFFGCTPLDKYPDAFHLDPPADPTYYSLGDLDIWVDIARVPPDASGWRRDDGERINIGMERAVALLNQYVAPYFRRISQDNFRITFQQGHEFMVEGEGGPQDAEMQQHKLVGACLDGCRYGRPGGLNRFLLSDVASDTGGRAYNGWAGFGLVSLRDAYMETIVHEMGHGWMSWPHSFSEVPWQPQAGAEILAPNPYSNFFDVMSSLALSPIPGWDHEMPSTLAVNRYAAGWIKPEDVALHLVDNAVYTLSKPRESGHQFLVVHSGRPYAFTTLEVLEERSLQFMPNIDVYDPSAPGGYRPRRYEGVLVSRYDQTAGTGTAARVGPALYNKENPEYLADVHWGRDDYSLIGDGETRDIGNGVRVAVMRNHDGSYEVTVSGGTVAEFEVWCSKTWFANEYDNGCALENIFEND